MFIWKTRVHQLFRSYKVECIVDSILLFEWHFRILRVFDLSFLTWEWDRLKMASLLILLQYCQISFILLLYVYCLSSMQMCEQAAEAHKSKGAIHSSRRNRITSDPSQHRRSSVDALLDGKSSASLPQVFMVLFPLEFQSPIRPFVL